ncbi:MAG: SPOR domain-containing protein [Bacteroidetes bacterium]|nr:SPOR domain-containing protein [Bacteroidota bacterium]
MRSNNVLTTLLYLLLAGLVVAAAYKACQIKKERQLEKDKQEAELQQALRDMGYNSNDTTASSGSSYVSSDNKTPVQAPGATNKSNLKPNARVNPSGIEDEPEAVPSANSKASKAAAPPNTLNARSTEPASTRTTKSGPALNAQERSVAPLPKATSKGVASSAKRIEGPGPAKAKYRVQAGSFTKMEGARRRLEEVIKLGYPNAEIGKINKGKFAVVIVLRTNNKEEAIRVADQLEQKGVDAAVMHQ